MISQLSSIFLLHDEPTYHRVLKPTQITTASLTHNPPVIKSVRPFKKNNHTREFINIFKEVLSTDKNLITDMYNNENQHKGFIENRHDQSIFSLISKTVGSEIIENETEFKNRKNEQYEYPFLSVRRYNHGPKDKIKYFLFKKRMMSRTHYF